MCPGPSMLSGTNLTCVWDNATGKKALEVSKQFQLDLTSDHRELVNRKVHLMVVADRTQWLWHVPGQDKQNSGTDNNNRTGRLEFAKSAAQPAAAALSIFLPFYSNTVVAMFNMAALGCRYYCYFIQNLLFFNSLGLVFSTMLTGVMSSNPFDPKGEK